MESQIATFAYFKELIASVNPGYEYNTSYLEDNAQLTRTNVESLLGFLFSDAGITMDEDQLVPESVLNNVIGFIGHTYTNAPDGCYIVAKSGRWYSYAGWDLLRVSNGYSELSAFSQDKAVGIGIKYEEHAFCVHPYIQSNMEFANATGSSFYVDIQTKSDNALDHFGEYKGEYNTRQYQSVTKMSRNLMNVIKNMYIGPSGRAAWVPTLGEWKIFVGQYFDETGVKTIAFELDPFNQRPTVSFGEDFAARIMSRAFGTFDYDCLYSSGDGFWTSSVGSRTDIVFVYITKVEPHSVQDMYQPVQFEYKADKPEYKSFLFCNVI